MRHSVLKEIRPHSVVDFATDTPGSVEIIPIPLPASAWRLGSVQSRQSAGE